jgi:hypothetical protein
MSRPEYDALVDAVARKMAEILTDNGLPVSSPDEGDLDDVERERWNVTLECARGAAGVIRERLNPQRTSQNNWFSHV